MHIIYTNITLALTTLDFTFFELFSHSCSLKPSLLHRFLSISSHDGLRIFLKSYPKFYLPNPLVIS